jgi:hypothetical protein
MRTATVLETANNVLDLGHAHERRGEWADASKQYHRAAYLFAEARSTAEAEDALRRSSTCAVLANR